MRVLLSEGKNTKQELNLEVKYIQGKYMFMCTKEYTDKYGRGFTVEPCNFNYTLTEGRKSKKKLDTFNSIVDKNAGTLTAMWKQGHYSSMCTLIENNSRSELWNNI